MYAALRLTLSLVLLAGCSAAGSIKGTVGDDTVPPMPEGDWVVYDVAGSSYVQLFTTDVPDSCETFTAVVEAQQAAVEQLFVDFDIEKAELAFQAAEQDNLPEEYWTTTLGVVADDLDAAVDEFDLDGLTASLTVTHVNGYTDWSGYLTTGELAADSDVSTAASGTATVTELVEDEGMSAEGDAELVDESGADAGAITWALSGQFCESYSDALSGL